MKKTLCLAVLAVLALASECCLASNPMAWRLGGSYIRFADTGTRNVLGDGWSVGGEYSFLKPGMEEAMGGDVSVAISYKRFDNSITGVNYTMDRWSLGLKWRGGPGATPECDGLYGGVGVAAGMVRVEPSVNTLKDYESRTSFEWRVFGGINAAKRFYAEIGYSRIPKLRNVELGDISFTVGLRF